MAQIGKQTLMLYSFMLKYHDESEFYKLIARRHFDATRKALLYQQIKGYYSYRYLEVEELDEGLNGHV
jgi:hypothetical protein